MQAFGLHNWDKHYLWYAYEINLDFGIKQIMAPDNIKEMLHGCWGDMFRVKTPRYLPEDATLSTIYRRHAILDLFNVGLYSVLAVGIFSLSGIVVKDFAGPSAILSVFVAALAIVCTGKRVSFSYMIKTVVFTLQ